MDDAFTPPDLKRLAIISGAAMVAAAVVFAAFVAPAERGVDPLGTGRLTGLNKLGSAKAPVERVAAAPTGDSASARFYPTPYRSDEIDIPLASPDGGGDAVYELEYKVKVRKGDSFVYAWTVDGVTNPEEFYYDFHGESPKGAGPIKVVELRQASGLSSNGVLVAPMDGVFGWFVQNSAVKPAVVRLKISGFYELVPPGGQGNERGIKPKD